MRILRKAEQGISFLDILLDETLCAGQIKMEKELVRTAGGVNHRLHAKRKYELILRIAAESPVVFEEPDEEGAYEGLLLFEDDENETVEQYGWQTDCYVIAKYSRELRENRYFDAAILSIVKQAEQNGIESPVSRYLEKMMARSNEFFRIDEETSPILIYKGDPVCHNVLTTFAEQFGMALEHAGEYVIWFDLQKEDVTGILKFMNRRFKAVIGVQSYLFSVKLADEVHYVHESIYGPKYNFVFDHPIWMKQHFAHQYSDYYVLTLDPNYVNFTKKYFKKNAIFFPPAGMLEDDGNKEEKIYDFTFIGTMGNYLAIAAEIHKMNRTERFLANRFLLIMRQHPNLTLEAAFAQAAKHQKLTLDDTEFAEQLRKVCKTGYCVMHYYRYKVVETLLKEGIRLDVFGDSWIQSPLKKYPNLVCHPDVTVEESLKIWKQSKLSLNVMSWHKGGFTERMAGIMLAEAVLVTDDTTYLKGHYDENDMLIFQLDELQNLPNRVGRLLSNETKRQKMAENGRKKTLREHTWEKRAEQFLDILKSRTDDI